MSLEKEVNSEAFTLIASATELTNLMFAHQLLHKLRMAGLDTNRIRQRVVANLEYKG